MLAALPGDLRVVPAMPWWIERSLMFFATIWLINLTNFMDGIDWITVAQFTPISLALAIAAVLGRSIVNIMYALIITWWPWYTRIVYGQVLSLREKQFVEAAKSTPRPTIAYLRANVKRMWIAGREVPLDSRHTRLYEKYKSRPVSK